MNNEIESRAGVESPQVFPAELAKGLASSYLPSLDGIRAIAAFLVVFYHFGVTWCPGGLGVLAFFVLSGFLITWLLLKEEERHGTIFLKLFYVRRSLRIFPAFYAYWLLVVGGLVMFHKHIVWPQAIASFFYVDNYYQAIRGDPGTGLSHTWSLGVEEQFYLLWPVLFLWFRNYRAQFLATAIAAIWVYREVSVLVFNRFEGYVYEAFDMRADHLLMGCLLAVLLRARLLPGLWRFLCRFPALVWVTVALLCLSTYFAATIQGRYRDTVGFVVEPLLVAVFIVQCIAARQVGLAAVLNWSWVAYLGRISYSIYLYQQIVGGPVEKLLASWPKLALIGQVAAVIVFASASYWLIERPFLKMKNRFAS